MRTDELTKTLTRLFGELTDGTHPKGGFVLNTGAYYGNVLPEPENETCAARVPLCQRGADDGLIGWGAGNRIESKLRIEGQSY